jgi:magnesium transporter
MIRRRRSEEDAVIIDCAVYRGGARTAERVSLEEARTAMRQPDAFVWLGLYQPTDEEFEVVRTTFALHELAVEDALQGHQRPKLETYDDTLFVVLKPVRYDDASEQIETGHIMLFVNPSFVVHVRYGEASPLTAARRHVEARPDLLCCGPGAVLHAVVDHIVDDYDGPVRGLEQDIAEIEEQVFAQAEENPAERIVNLEREALEFHRAVAPLAVPLDRLARGHYKVVHPDLHEYFRDVHDHLLRTVGQVEGFRELLSSILQANLTQVSVRQNEDMRKISAWVAIAAVPTMVAGIYGMNFRFMPELAWRWGYPVVMSLTVLFCVVLYRRFKRAGWL